MGAGVRGGIVGVGPVLHLCSGYSAQRLYSRLFAALHDTGVRQAVYVPVRNASELAVPGPPRSGIPYHVQHVLRPYHRLFFRTKVRTVSQNLLRVESPRDYGLMHAHFLYSDGAVALRLHETFGTPYIVAVRNTDINVFMTLRPDLRGLMHRIATGARALVFLSPAYRAQFFDRLPPALARGLAGRSHVVPNGVGTEWLDASPPARDANGAAPLRVLFVGELTHNKNVLRLLEATAVVAARRPVSLTLVGGGGNGARAVEAALASGRFPFARAVGRVDDPTQLRALYREHDVFAMPSLTETFGLVYLEALSQGLPVLHARGQGVDGFFVAGTVSESVDPRSVDAIAQGLEALASRAAAQRAACIAAAGSFAWTKIAATYHDLYHSVTPNTGPG